MWWGLLHLSLPLWLGSWGPKVLGQSTGGHDHGDVWGSWGATIRVCIYVAIVGGTGQGEGGQEDDPWGDWRDHSVRPWVITSRWEVTEPAEGCECIMEVVTVTVSHREFGCKPNQHEGHYDSPCLVSEGEFFNDEEDRVDVRHRDSLILDKSRNGEQ